MHMSPKRSQSHQRKIRSTYGSEGWGPIGDHTLCAVMNDLRVCARLAWPQTDRALVVTSETRYRDLLGVKWSQVQILSARPT